MRDSATEIIDAAVKKAAMQGAFASSTGVAEHAALLAQTASAKRSSGNAVAEDQGDNFLTQWLTTEKQAELAELFEVSHASGEVGFEDLCNKLNEVGINLDL